MPWLELKRSFHNLKTYIEERACESCVDDVGLLDPFIGEATHAGGLCEQCAVTHHYL